MNEGRYEVFDIHEEDTNRIDNHQLSEQSRHDKLLKHFVGEGKSDYYTRQWNKDRKFSWNWAAFILVFFWLGYRKMYLYVALILCCYLVIDVLGTLIGFDAVAIETTITTLISISLGIFGNKLYNHFAEREISKLQKKFESDQLLEKIEERGGGREEGVLFIFLLIVAYALLSEFLIKLLVL